MKRMIAGATAAALLSSCSWIFMHGPPDPPIRQDPDCSSSRVPPIVDTLFAVPYLIVGTAFLVGGISETDDPDWRKAMEVIGGVTLGTGLIWGMSARYGYGTASDCRDAEEEWEHYVNTPPETAPAQQGRWPGTERAHCGQNGYCQPGLTCASGYCVRLPR